LGHSNQT